MKAENKRCCKNCVHCKCIGTNTLTCKFIKGKSSGWISTEFAEKMYCHRFSLPNGTDDTELTISNFLWLVVFILVFVCALYAILEYSGIINYLSGLI
jgi:hypothetical protein